MIGCEDKGSLIISVEVLHDLRDFSDTRIHDLDVVQVLLRVGTVGVASGVQTKQMEEEHQFILP